MYINKNRDTSIPPPPDSDHVLQTQEVELNIEFERLQTQIANGDISSAYETWVKVGFLLKDVSGLYARINAERMAPS